MTELKNHAHVVTRTQPVVICVLILLALSLSAGLAYQGITHDEEIGGFRLAAERIAANQPLLNASDVAADNFHAGDKTRADNDNRGASLKEFSLAVTLKSD